MNSLESGCKVLDSCCDQKLVGPTGISSMDVEKIIQRRDELEKLLGPAIEWLSKNGEDGQFILLSKKCIAHLKGDNNIYFERGYLMDMGRKPCENRKLSIEVSI